MFYLYYYTIWIFYTLFGFSILLLPFKGCFDAMIPVATLDPFGVVSPVFFTGDDLSPTLVKIKSLAERGLLITVFSYGFNINLLVFVESFIYSFSYCALTLLDPRSPPIVFFFYPFNVVYVVVIELVLFFFDS